MHDKLEYKHSEILTKS
uniref:Uncharacterized protein n=1 Tax=Arundo donax TaxID=35708 RepID=A0A0A8ZVJ9_ARUDO